ncbi:hypothetical protein HK405_007333 [Cladochytrium tenue]|nr:hypothetical protein HK405_007333 [Cladochytrium tenue]
MAPNPFHAGIPDVEWYSIHVVALCAIALSAAGSIYIIVLTLAKASRESVLPIQLLPMFISMADGITNLFHGIDHTISLAHGRVLDGPGCVALGFGTYFGINSTPFWVSACAVYVHLCIVHERQPDVGPGGLYMNLVCWGGPLIINVVALIRGEFGSEALWCGLPHTIVYFNVWVLAAGLAICVVMYSWTWGYIMSKAGPASAEHRGWHSSGSGGGSGAASRFSPRPRPSRFVVLRRESSDIVDQRRDDLNSTLTSEKPRADAMAVFGKSASSSTFLSGSVTNDCDIELAPTSREAKWMRAGPAVPAVPPSPGLGSGSASGSGGGGGVSEADDLGRKLRRAANRLPVFVLIFVVQWTPFVVYAFYVLAGQTQFWATLLVVALSNSGGVWNAIAYRKLVVRSGNRPRS